MTRITRLVRPDAPTSNWKAALPVLAMAAACLAGCAGTATTVGTASTSSDALEHSALSTKPLARFDTCAKPEYTPEALARRAQGTVSLRFLVDTDGSVADAQVMKSSGDRSLDEAARVAIAKCRFTPGMADGKPARAWVPVQYVWTLG